ncbi:hypothetical protein CBL_10703 [Carabus blaptoides fortunei]
MALGVEISEHDLTSISHRQPGEVRLHTHMYVSMCAMDDDDNTNTLMYTSTHDATGIQHLKNPMRHHRQQRKTRVIRSQVEADDKIVMIDETQRKKIHAKGEPTNTQWLHNFLPSMAIHFNVSRCD